MSEVLAPPDNAESRTRLHQQQTRNAGLAASTPKQDSVFRSTHPRVPIRRKTSQADNSDNRSRNRGPPPRERGPHAAECQPFSLDRWASPQGYTATAGGHRAPSPHILTAATGDQRASGMTGDHRAPGTTVDHRAPGTTRDHSAPRTTADRRAHLLRAVLRPLGTAGDRLAPSPDGRLTATGDRRPPPPPHPTRPHAILRRVAGGHGRVLGHLPRAAGSSHPRFQHPATISSGPCYGRCGPPGTINSGPCYDHCGPPGTIT